MTQNIVEAFADAFEDSDVSVAVMDDGELKQVVSTKRVEESEENSGNVQKAIIDGFKEVIKNANVNKDNFEDFYFNFNVVETITKIIGEKKTKKLNLRLEKIMSYNRQFRALLLKAVGCDNQIKKEEEVE